MANAAEQHVGRLIEVSVDTGFRSAADVQAMFGSIAQVISRVEHKKIVLVADWRRCPIMSGEASSAFTDSLRRNNERVQRAAALAKADSPSAMLQFLRLIREADNPNRKLFHDKTELARWLDEVLDPAEQKRLREFLERP